MVAAILYGLLNSEYRIGLYNDDVLYVITSKDFWNTQLLHPLLQIKPDYPLPGLPLLLAPFTKLFQPNWQMLDWVSVIVTLVSVLLFGKWMRKWFSHTETLVLTALFGLNPLIMRFSGIIMPNAYFMLAAVTSFLMMESALKNPSLQKGLALGFISGWAMALRPQGFLLPVSILGCLLLTFDGRRLIRWILIPLAGWAVFLALWFHHRVVETTEYGGDLYELKLFWMRHFLLGLSFPIRWFQSIIMTSWDIFASVPPSEFMIFSWCAFLLLGSVIGIGFWRLWNRPGVHHGTLLAVALFSLALIAVHIFWQVTDARYFIPLLPIVSMCIVSACSGRRWMMGTLLILILVNVVECGNAVFKAKWNTDPMNGPPVKTLDWVKENTPPEAKFISNIAPSVDLYTERQAAPLLNVEGVDILQYVLLSRGFGYILIRNGTATAPLVDSKENVNILWDRYRHWMDNYPDRFPLVFIGPSKTARVFSVTSDQHFFKAYEKFVSAAQHTKAQDYNQALKEVQESLRLFPRLGCAADLLGALYFMGQRYDLAEQMFLKAAEYTPDSPHPIANRASVYHLQGKMSEADDLLMKALDTNRRGVNDHRFEERIRRLREQWQNNRHEMLIESIPTT